MKGSCLGVFRRFIEKSQQEQIGVSSKRCTRENEQQFSIGEDKINENWKVLEKRKKNARGVKKMQHTPGGG
jgi:hypothetical protein